VRGQFWYLSVFCSSETYEYGYGEGRWDTLVVTAVNLWTVRGS
jgi:hypothetical protein